ncbi:MAG: hypothetical protein KBT87_14495 [Gammaproteobacteria bacterium]|nr:hypothetical protein [Gammaproteobacteria bacterium]MBQ0775878.1 hypothetical protein [Gammaproteobacteria bacterium]
MGSPRAISDENGNIIKDITYDSYGNVISDSNPAFTILFGFAGGLQDIDTGLIRYGFRDYDSRIGRWTARDPIGLSGGLNVYGYVGQNPLSNVDPSGLVTFELGDRQFNPGGPSQGIVTFKPTLDVNSDGSIEGGGIEIQLRERQRKDSDSIDYPPYPLPQGEKGLDKEVLERLDEKYKDELKDLIDKMPGTDEAKEKLKEALDRENRRDIKCP